MRHIYICLVILALIAVSADAQENELQKEKMEMSTLSLTSLPANQMPAGWQFISGSWQRKPLIRPQRNPNVTAAVESERHVAFPGVCMTKKGTLIAVYREGRTHASDKGRIMLVRSTDKGRTWGEPEFVYDDPTIDDRNAAIGCMDDGTLCVIWDKYLRGTAHHWAWISTSTDEGRTWSEAMKLSKEEDVHTRSRPLDLGNGKWLLHYATETSNKKAENYLNIYDPKTKTGEEFSATPSGEMNFAEETGVTRAPNGDLVALGRSETDPVLWQIVSKDNARSWSLPKMTNIPSQFAPPDLITLTNGWVLCSFSFRERRNERLVVSRDNGETWDVENSVDVFQGTAEVGGDRSYIASVQLDDKTVGSVLYETQEPPTGGHIWFVTTKIAELDAPKENVLYQGDTEAEASFALWPDSIGGEKVEFSYRFTGLFGPPPNIVGILLNFQNPENYTSMEFQMGTSPDRQSLPYNYVQLVKCVNGEKEVSSGQGAKGGWFDHGNIVRLGARRNGDEWVLTLDGIDQFSVPASMGKPCGIIVRRAAVAVYDISWSK